MNRKFRDLSSMFLVSAGVLAFEVILTRLFCLTFWYHFASLVIALALTGFGVAGSLLAVGMPGLENRRDAALAVTALGAGLAMLFSYQAVLGVGLEPLALAWAGRPWFKLGLVCLILVVPFLLGASHIGLILAYSEKPNHAYAANLAGSGAGCLAAALSLSRLLPHQALYAAVCLALLGFVIQALNCPRRILLSLILLGLGASSGVLVFPLVLHYEPFKDRSNALAAQGSRLDEQAVGLDGVVEVIGGPAFHYAPGLSLSCTAALPSQRGLFVDGDLVGPITKVEPGNPPPDFVKCLLSNLVYHTLRPKKILIINPGGGLNLLSALESDADTITGVEENPQIYQLMTGPMAGFSGNIYRRPKVNVIQADPVNFLRRTRDRFDLILLGQGVRWGAGSSSGLGVSRLLTVEGLNLMLGLLSPRGSMAVSGPLMYPPRASIRLLATAARSLHETGRDPKRSVVLARDWSTVLLIIKPGAFSSDEIKRLTTETARQGFNLSYIPQENKSAFNRFHQLPGNPLAKAASMIFSGKSQALFDQSYFNLKPATRDRPYFFNFFRFKTLRLIIGSKTSKLLSVTEWGLLFTWGALGAALLLAGAGIFSPLFKLGPPPKNLIFFILIGMGYMVAEITLLAETIYHLGRPAQAFPLVVGVFLMLSGVGSLIWGQRPPGFFSLASAVILPFVFFILRCLPGESAMIALVLAPAALLMGVPFAGGLIHLIGSNPSMRAWGYGVNGFFSVTGSLIATMICLQLGHTAAIFFAGGCYLLAGVLTKGKRL